MAASLPALRAPGTVRRVRPVSIATFALVSLFAVWPQRAAAHPGIDAAREQAFAARFEEALSSLDVALAAGALTRADLTAAFEVRAIVLQGLGRDGDADVALRALAALEPEWSFDPRTPERVRARFAAIAATTARMSVQIAARREPAGVVFETRLVDPAGLVGAVTIEARTGRGSWAPVSGDPPCLSAAATDRVEYRAVAVGAAGAELARAEGVSAGELLRGETPVEPTPSRGSGSAWPWIGLGSAVVAAAVIVVLVLVLQPDPITVLQPPMPE